MGGARGREKRSLVACLLALWPLALAATVPKGWELREALEVLDKDLYDSGPGPQRPFIEQLKNPCWSAQPGGGEGGGGGGGADWGSDGAAAAAAAVEGDGLRCLPYALVLGGFQSGAASLFSALYKHPMVVKTSVSRWHFWAEADKSASGYIGVLKDAAAKVAQWYGSVVAAPPAAAAVAAGGGGAGEAGGEAWLRAQQKVILDGSASTFAFYWSPGVRAHRAFGASMGPCWKACHSAHREGPEREACLDGCYQPARVADRQVAARIGLPYHDVSLPLLVSAVYGKRPPKMVVLLRDPVDRLYSAFWRYGHYYSKYGKSAEGFAAYATEQLSAVRGCMSLNASDADPDMSTSCVLAFETWGLQQERLFFHGDQILRGVYAPYLERWFKFFDRRQLLVLRSERFFAEPVKTYERVLAFLDLDPAAVPYKGRIEKLSRAKEGAEALAKALKVEPDERVWADIRRGLTASLDGRYGANRAAATEMLGGREGGRAAGEGADGGTGSRPRMPTAVRQELAAFYEPYNRQLAELLDDPDFVRGWG